MNQHLIYIGDILKERGSEQDIFLNFKFSPVEIGPEKIEFTTNVVGDLRAANLGDEVSLTGTVKTSIKLNCNRCLTDFETDETLEINEFYEDKEHASRDDQFPIIGKKIDVGSAIEQSVLLAVPLKVLCREDCKGLCSVCGANLNEGDCGHRPVKENAFNVLKDLLKDA